MYSFFPENAIMMASVNPYKFSPPRELEVVYQSLKESTRVPTCGPSPVLLLNPLPSNGSTRMSSWRQVVVFCFGVVLGLFVALLIRKSVLGAIHFCLQVNRESLVKGSVDPFDIIGANRSKYPHNSNSNLLFVGVMTAQQYLDTRAVAVYETWAQHIPGKIAFFTSEFSVTNSKIPIIRLKGVDDSYPPQKKAFMMIKYMHDHYLDHFEFFMRADDDVYIRPEKLEQFLRSVNSSLPHFIGQTGRGNSDEYGRLALLEYENFCMGGPGVIFSRPTLARTAPHVGTCLRNMHSTHEDVEVGRCVQRFAGIPCTWSYEVSIYW